VNFFFQFLHNIQHWEELDGFYLYVLGCILDEIINRYILETLPSKQKKLSWLIRAGRCGYVELEVHHCLFLILGILTLLLPDAALWFYSLMSLSLA
jgi:hypothetical protein